jgi:hypothetical protein
MTTPYTGDRSDPTAVDNDYDLLTDGEKPKAALWRVTYEQMADNIARLDARTGNPGGDTIDRVCDDGFVLETDATGVSYWNIDSAMAYAEQLDVAGAVRRGIRMRLNVPHECTIDRIKVHITPPTGHAAFPGGAPANMPRFRVLRQAPGDAGPTVVHTTTDASASVAVYEAAHYLDSGAGLGIVVNRSTNSYWLSVEGEGYTNAIAGLRVQLCALVTILPAYVDRGAG